jgi:uncharacterized protein with PIN domain
LLIRTFVTHGYCLRTTDPRQQLAEVLRRFDLFNLIKPFQRCLRCTSLLRLVDKADIIDCLPPKIKEDYDEFRRCQGCAQVYWKGSHYDRMREFIDEIVQNL